MPFEILGLSTFPNLVNMDLVISLDYKVLSNGLYLYFSDWVINHLLPQEWFLHVYIKDSYITHLISNEQYLVIPKHGCVNYLIWIFKAKEFIVKSRIKGF